MWVSVLLGERHIHVYIVDEDFEFCINGFFLESGFV